MYRFEVDADQHLLRMTLRGLWPLDELRRLNVDRMELLQKLGWTPRRYVSLADLREHAVQTRDVAAEAKVYLRNATITPRRHAVLVATALTKLQATRVAVEGDARTFNSEAEAMAWLLDNRLAA